MNRSLFFVLTLLLILTACGSPSASGTDGLNVLASTTFLADITRNIAGERAQVESLLPVGADPHAYQPAPSDVAKIAEAGLLVLNGLEYEHFIEPLLENAGGAAAVVEASAGLSPREDSGSEHGVDPHMWLDPVLVVSYVETIRDGLISVDPQGAETYRANAQAYIAQLQELDAWIVDQVSLVPQGRRLLVTNHEAVGYFAQRYGFTLIGTVLPGPSTEAGTSAQEMAALIEQIKAEQVPAIFLGEVENPDLALQIAAESGAKVVTDLYFESLTEGAPAATYIDMMKHDVSRIVEALK